MQTPEEIVATAIELLEAGVTAIKVFHIELESRKSSCGSYYCFAENLDEARQKFEEIAPGRVLWDVDGTYDLLVSTAGLSEHYTMDDRLEDILSDIENEGIPRRDHIIYINEVSFGGIEWH